MANEALLVAAQKALAVSQANVAVVTDRRGGGTATELDVQRASADVSRTEQDLSSASFAVVTGRRTLETLSGLSPEPVTQFPIDDLREEAPLEHWMADTSRLPAVQSAELAQRSAAAGADAARVAWLPTVSASAQERFTNAPSLTLHKSYYTLRHRHLEARRDDAGRGARAARSSRDLRGACAGQQAQRGRRHFSGLLSGAELD